MSAGTANGTAAALARSAAGGGGRADAWVSRWGLPSHWDRSGYAGVHALARAVDVSWTFFAASVTAAMAFVGSLSSNFSEA
ncbi:hypothetical protein SAMN05421505_11514 [Sinosporangium album]|uniref:Uncharacterized protein n=1 Tax=Sinosporangium album TaxID=504805 RepID=A0A1G8C0B7_9ACTN|nr:hypothetical protein SAMN05421505_11514 [Sinosporangium album]